MIFKNKKAGSTGFVIAIILSIILLYLAYTYNFSKYGLIMSGIFIIALFAIIIVSSLSKTPYYGSKRPQSHFALGLVIFLIAMFLISYVYSLTPSTDGFVKIIGTLSSSISKTLDNTFASLFGMNFVSSMRTIAGIKSGADFWKHFFQSLAFGFSAAILMYLGNIIMIIIRGQPQRYAFFYHLSTLGKGGGGGIWLDFVAGSIGGVIIFTLAFATLMQIGIINQFIKIITFYWLTNWFIYPFILAIYFGYGPEILTQLAYYRKYRKLQKRVTGFKAGLTAVSSAGKG